MRFRKRMRKTGKPGLIRGSRLKRKLKYQPIIESESGIKVRSKLEKCCADWFKLNNIEFLYEPLMLINGRQFRPDFYLPEYNLFLEICGYNHMPHYRDRIQQKKQIYGKYNLRTIFININKHKSIEIILKHELEKHGIIVN